MSTSITRSGAGPLGEGREPAKVGEEHRSDEPDSAEPRATVGAGEHLRDNRLREESGEDVVHTRTLELVQHPPAEAGADPRPKEDGVEWLREVVLGSELDAPHDAGEVVEGGDHDHRNLAQHRIRLHLLERAHAVELGHHDVEQNDVPRPGPEELERLAAVLGRADLVSGGCQRPCEERPIDPVVVDNEDRAGRRRGHGAAPPSRSATRRGRTMSHSASIDSTCRRAAEVARTRVGFEAAAEQLELDRAEHRSVCLQRVGGASDENSIAGARSLLQLGQPLLPFLQTGIHDLGQRLGITAEQFHKRANRLGIECVVGSGEVTCRHAACRKRAYGRPGRGATPVSRRAADARRRLPKARAARQVAPRRAPARRPRPLYAR